MNFHWQAGSSKLSCAKHATESCGRLLLGLLRRNLSAADCAKRRGLILFLLNSLSFFGKWAEKQKKLEGFRDHSFTLFCLKRGSSWTISSSIVALGFHK